MFLSLKKHIESGPAELAAALLQLSQALLRSLRIHSVRGEETELRRFQTALTGLERRIADSPTAHEVLMMAGEASRAHEDYCHHTNRFLEVQSAELRTMIGMLTSTVATVSKASQTSVEQLTRVEKRMENVGQLTDLPRLKIELADCLAMVREESFRQREENAATIHKLQRGVSDSRNRMAEARMGNKEAEQLPEVLDEVTHLPGRADAEDALRVARQRKTAFAAVLPVDRLMLVNSRFGTEAMDIVLMYFADYLRAHLQPADKLFRWSSNAFLALVDRDYAQDSVRADLSRFASSKLDVTLEHHGREILIPLSSTWALFSAREGRNHEAMVARIDSFLRDKMHVKDSF